MFSHLSQLDRAFANTANPQNLFLSHTHDSALNMLSDVPEEGNNLRVLIGEAGMGKTMLLVHLLEQFKSSALTAHLFWTQLVGDQFLRYFLHELRILHPAEDSGQARKLFSRVLEGEFFRGRKVIVAIDEAHNLELPMLRGLGEVLDSNIARSKDLKVIFAGLPHLADKLASAEARKIWTRISAIASLAPLTFDETIQYINHKLRVFAPQGLASFTPDALATIATLAEGIPSNINNVCDAAIYLAEQRACNVIESDIILEAAAQRERRLNRQGSTPHSIALPPDGQRADAVANQQAFVASQQHVSTPAPNDNATSLGDTSAEEKLVNQEIAAVSDSIRQPFGEHGLASSGTVGELVAALDRPESELVHAIQTAMSFYEAVGRKPPVSLSRLQKGKQTVTEDTDTGPKPPEQRVTDCRAGDSPGKDALVQDVAASCSSDEGINCDAHNYEGRPETVFVLSADRALDRLREASVLQNVDEPPSSRLRIVVPAVIVALVVGLATYTMTPTERTYFLRIARQLARAKGATKDIVFLPKRSQPVPGAKNASTVSSRKEPSPRVETAPLTGKGAQSGSGIELLQEDGIQAPAGEISKSLQQAALAGDENAEFELGTAYAMGRGVPADPVIGYMWLTLAFANGNRQAESPIRQLTQQLSQPQIAQIRSKVGEMYTNGMGVQADKVTAYMWYLLAELAGEKRSTVAKSQLAARMTSDERSEASARASRWLRRHQK
jgi:general secretion pathway protein A